MTQRTDRRFLQSQPFGEEGYGRQLGVRQSHSRRLKCGGSDSTWMLVDGERNRIANIPPRHSVSKSTF
jgi:hypothetical protein